MRLRETGVEEERGNRTNGNIVSLIFKLHCTSMGYDNEFEQRQGCWCQEGVWAQWNLVIVATASRGSRMFLSDHLLPILL